MQPMPAMMKEMTIAGPACWAAATPVSTKMPVPMMPPIPKAISAGMPRARTRCLPAASSWYSETGLIANKPGFFMQCSARCRCEVHSTRRRTMQAIRSAQSGGSEPPGGSDAAQFLRYVWGECLDHCVVHLGRAGDDVRAELIGGAIEHAHAPAGLLDQQRAGCGIPGLESQLPETIDAAGRDIGEIQRGGAGPADARGQCRQRAEHREVMVDVWIVVAKRKAGG